MSRYPTCSAELSREQSMGSAKLGANMAWVQKWLSFGVCFLSIRSSSELHFCPALQPQIGPCTTAELEFCRSKMTTGMPFEIYSAQQDKSFCSKYTLDIDIQRNEPNVHVEEVRNLTPL